MEQPGLSRAEGVVRFIESLTITSGIKAGQPFVLLPFQREIIERWYATDASGRRIVRSGLLSMARKGGKTALLAAIACAHLVGPETERRGQIVAVAAAKEQAALLFDEIVAFLNAHPLRERVNIQTHMKVITDLVSGTRFRALPSDAKTVHGLSPSLVVIDELGVWGTGKGRLLYDALTSAGGARKEPLCVVISTQSADDHSVMSELVNYTKAVNDGTIADPSFAGFVYDVPMAANPFDEGQWALANPGLGVYRATDEIRIAAEQAQQMPARLAAFRLWYLNQRVHAEGRWLSVERWDACSVGDLGPLEARTAFVGIDIAAKVDLTALAVLMPNHLGGYDILLEFFLPGDMVDALAAKARLPYRDLARAGWSTLTSGNVFDPSHLTERLHALGKVLDIRTVGVDPWSSKGLLPNWQREGIPATEVRQSLSVLTGPAKEFERLLSAGTLRHLGNPIMRRMITDVIVDMDAAGNIRPNREKSGKIDGVVACLCALERAMVDEGPSVYDTRPPLLVDF